MNNVVNLFEKKAEKHTPEQRLKLFCITEIMGSEHTAAIISKMSIDEAFTFLAEKAMEWDQIKANGELNK